MKTRTVAGTVRASKQTVFQELQRIQNLEVLPKSEKSAILYEDGFEPQSWLNF